MIKIPHPLASHSANRGLATQWEWPNFFLPKEEIIHWHYQAALYGLHWRLHQGAASNMVLTVYGKGKHSLLQYTSGGTLKKKWGGWAHSNGWNKINVMVSNIWFSMCLIQFHLLHSIHYYDPSFPHQPPLMSPLCLVLPFMYTCKSSKGKVEV